MNPVEFFRLPNETFSKLGTYETRDFESNGWTGQRTDFPPKKPGNTTFEWFFTNSKWVVYEGILTQEKFLPSQFEYR